MPTPLAIKPGSDMIRKLRSLLSLSSAVILALSLCVSASFAFETRARSAFVIDQTTGMILLAKNADTPLPPASMSKLMTLFVAFEALRDGRLSLDDKLPVSQHAMDYGGSTMFLDTSDRIKVEDLLRGIIVLSGNDACAVIAEALSPDGSEAGFARLMTQRAQTLGMSNSRFVNSNGWPAPGQRMSMRDLSLLASHLIEDFPQFYPLFSERQFAFDGRAPQNTKNRNPLLSLGIGADGLKTGHTKEAGYGLVGSAKQGNRRIIFVISGLDSARARAHEAEAIVNWAFRQFTQRDVAKAGTVIAKADVFMGQSTEVGMTPVKDFSTLVPVTNSNQITAEVIYKGPIQAPISKGQALGELLLSPEGLPETRIPLVADRDVARAGFLGRIKTVSGFLLKRLQDGPAPEGAL